MQTILVAGAGKSSFHLIHYLLSNANRQIWKIIVADGDIDAINEKIKDHPSAEAAVIDIANNSDREALVKKADIVISLMPPQLHDLLANDCLKYKKNLITSSYISEGIKALDKEVKEAGLMFMCEMGLDPGIDHMSASQIIHGIQRVASTISSFKSYCGGLIAPEYDDNPWHYKFTWNPRNVVTAGTGGAKFLQGGKETEVAYSELFNNNKKIKVDSLAPLAYYPNRDSLRYIGQYDIPEIKTFMRATLRHPSFCKGWDAIIQLGLTSQDDSIVTQGKTYAGWVKQKIGNQNNSGLTDLVAKKLSVPKNDKVISMLKWLGLFDEKPLPTGKYSSADILLQLLLEKWEMKPEEKDMVVMQHEVEYNHRGTKNILTSSMVVTGDNREHSAMAKTVGLPMGILAKLVLTKRINPPTGVHIPNMPSVYRPVLTELKHHGISFNEVVA
jgi:saccharopine dehydrogenase-like NADP-dependent oxidoreductase